MIASMRADLRYLALLAEQAIGLSFELGTALWGIDTGELLELRTRGSGACPQVMRRIRTPRTPRLGARSDTSRVCGEPTLYEGSSQPQIGDRQRVRIAECAHGNVGCRPGSYSREHLQPSHSLLAINTVIQHQVTLSNALRKRPECGGPALAASRSQMADDTASAASASHRLNQVAARVGEMQMAGIQSTLHRLVELADAGESRRKGNRSKREVRLVDQQTSRLGPTAARQGKRANTHLCHEFAMQVPFTYGQPTGKSSDSLAINDATSDES